jgi:hypothetical protein
MTIHKTYYDVLGVSRSASQREIKARFRQLAKKLHPDKNKAPDAEHRFIEVFTAYQVLTGSSKSTYDASLSVRRNQSTTQNLDDTIAKATNTATSYAKRSYSDFAKDVLRRSAVATMGIILLLVMFPIYLILMLGFMIVGPYIAMAVVFYIFGYAIYLMATEKSR